MKGLAGFCDGSFSEVNRHIADLEKRTGRMVGPANQGADACKQFEEIEWFHQIIIRSRIESTHPVFACVPRGEHEDRRLSGLPQTEQYFPPIQLWEHDVQ